MKRKLKHNIVRCKKCNAIIESLHTYDLKNCNCQSVRIDGGLDYAKRLLPSGANLEDYIEELSEWETYLKSFCKNSYITVLSKSNILKIIITL